MFFCPLYCIYNARSPPCYYSYFEISAFTHNPGSLFFQENLTQGRVDIVSIGNRLERKTAIATNAGDAAFFADKIAGTTDMEGNERLGSGASVQLSSVIECL